MLKAKVFATVVLFMFGLFCLLLIGPGVIDFSDTDGINQNNQESNFDGDINEQEVTEEFNRLINEERSKNNLQEYTISPEIVEIAKYKADLMKSEGYVSHTSPDGEGIKDRFEKFSVSCESIGENIAQTHYMRDVDVNYGGTDYYNTEEELAKGIFKQFMASPPHKENILSDEWTQAGSAISVNDEGKVYVAHEFCG